MENINYVTEDELHSSETQSFLVQVDEPSLVISRNRVIFVFAVATFTIAVIVIVIVILVTSSSGTHHDSNSFSSISITSIPSEIPSQQPSSQPSSFPFIHPAICILNKSEPCYLKNMKSTTVVYPGGNTGCINASVPFAFQVFPGKSLDKLIFSFQGGGVCWDDSSTSQASCRLPLSIQLPYGIYDNKNALNYFSDYTIVHVLYCSGDLHIGDVTRNYSYNGNTVIQSGYNNTLATIRWVLGQIGNDTTSQLSPIFSKLVILGSSAGSLAAQLWSDFLLNTFKYESAAVISDSFVGVLPDYQGTLVKNFGLCNHQELIGKDLKLLNKCYNSSLSVIEVTRSHILKNSQISYAFIQSKTDAVQLAYYNLIALSDPNEATNKTINAVGFYNKLNNMAAQLNGTAPNFSIYLIDGIWHQFTIYGIYYTTDTSSYNNTTKRSKCIPVIPLYKWINQFASSSQSLSLSSPPPSSISASASTTLKVVVIPEIKSMCEGSTNLQFAKETYCDKRYIKSCRII